MTRALQTQLWAVGMEEKHHINQNQPSAYVWRRNLMRDYPTITAGCLGWSSGTMLHDGGLVGYFHRGFTLQQAQCGNMAQHRRAAGHSVVAQVRFPNHIFSLRYPCPSSCLRTNKSQDRPRDKLTCRPSALALHVLQTGWIAYSILERLGSLAPCSLFFPPGIFLPYSQHKRQQLAWCPLAPATSVMASHIFIRTTRCREPSYYENEMNGSRAYQRRIRPFQSRNLHCISP